MPLTEEEEELRELERIPRDSQLYSLRKAHLQEMIGLKYEIQRLQQESQKDDLERQVIWMPFGNRVTENASFEQKPCMD